MTNNFLHLHKSAPWKVMLHHFLFHTVTVETDNHHWTGLMLKKMSKRDDYEARTIRSRFFKYMISKQICASLSNPFSFPQRQILTFCHGL